MAEGSTSGGITSGGGFSTYYPQHTWQSAAVSGYFPTAATLGKSPKTGYAANGRAYPDISLAGMNYLVVIGGNKYDVSGTSASCPAVAGFISNINAARLAAGKGSVGWINPALYAAPSTFVNDITIGNNRCGGLDSNKRNTCCKQGFFAASGWDPTTGLGSIDYKRMSLNFQAYYLTPTTVKSASTRNTFGTFVSYKISAFRPSTILHFMCNTHLLVCYYHEAVYSHVTY